MQYFAKVNEAGALSNDDLEEGIFSALDKLGPKKKVLVIPPDITRFYSYSGILTKLVFQYFLYRHQSKENGILKVPINIIKML